MSFRLPNTEDNEQGERVVNRRLDLSYLFDPKQKKMVVVEDKEFGNGKFEPSLRIVNQDDAES